MHVNNPNEKHINYWIWKCCYTSSIKPKKNFFCIHQIYSRNIKNAANLANLVNAKYTSKITEIEKVDLIIIAVSDDVIIQIIDNLKGTNIVHTSGSVGLDIFNNKYKNYGVLYPLQTFNKKNAVDIKHTPILIETNNCEFEKELVKIASKYLIIFLF